MPTEFKLPELGENVESGNVVRIMVSEGDTVEKDQPIIELETEKASIEVPSSVRGTIKELRVKEGDEIKVGQVILTVEEEAEEKEKKEKREEKKPPAKKVAKKEKEAEAEEEEEEVGEEVGEEEEEEEQEVETEAKEEAIAEEEEEEEKEVEKKARKQAPAKPKTEYPKLAIPPPKARGPAVPAAPSVRRFAREIGIDINEVPGTGSGGRISIEDVKAYARQLQAAEARPVAARVVAAPLPDFAKWGEVERRSMSTLRRKTAEQMATAWSTIPHVTQYDKADITRLEQQRERFGKQVESEGGKLTLTAILLKVAASALKAFPEFNAGIDVERNEIIYKKYVHVGVAVDTDRGLLVPVIRDVNQKNIFQLSLELTQIAEKARTKKLTLEEMQGGTFTITNLGGIGGTQFSPIVNAPEAAILGVSRASTEAVHRNGQFEPRLILPLSLSYDHRIIDGADAARFLRWICQALEEPFLLVFEG